jgi:hypothetical protein
MDCYYFNEYITLAFALQCIHDFERKEREIASVHGIVNRIIEDNDDSFFIIFVIGYNNLIEIL